MVEIRNLCKFAQFCAFTVLIRKWIENVSSQGKIIRKHWFFDRIFLKCLDLNKNKLRHFTRSVFGLPRSTFYFFQKFEYVKSLRKIVWFFNVCQQKRGCVRNYANCCVLSIRGFIIYCLSFVKADTSAVRNQNTKKDIQNGNFKKQFCFCFGRWRNQ